MENITNTTINKPFSLVTNELRTGIVDLMNKSNLHIELLDMILGGIYTEVHQQAIAQAEREKAEYEKALAEASKEESTKK